MVELFKMELKITLTVEQWNQVLDLLADGPVKKAMPLINAIMEQSKAQQSGEPLVPSLNGTKD